MNRSNWQPVFGLGGVLFIAGITGQALGLFGPAVTFGPLGLGVVLMAAGLVARTRPI